MTAGNEIPNSLKTRSLACGMAISLLYGFFYTFSSMYVYCGGYLRQFDSFVDPEGKLLLVVLPLWHIAQGLTGIIAVKLADYIGYWSLNYIAAVWFCLNNVAAIYIKSYWLFVLVYGLSNGIACGLLYLPPLYISWTYFPNKKSVVSGCILFVVAISNFIYSPMVTLIVNPNNINPNDKAVIERVPLLFTILSVVFLFITILACSLQPSPWSPKNVGEKSSPASNTIGSPKLKPKRIKNSKRFSELLKSFDKSTLEKMAKIKLTQEVGTQGGENLMIVGLLEEEKIGNLTFEEEMYMPSEGEETSPPATKGAKGESEKQQQQIGEQPEATIGKELIEKEGKEDELREEELKQIAKTAASDSECPSMAIAYRSKELLMLGAMAICSNTYCYAFIASWKYNFTQYLGLSDRELAAILSVSAISSALARVVGGFAYLRFNFKQIYGLNILLIIISSFTFVPMINNVKRGWVGYLFLIHAFLSLGIANVSFPTVCPKIFGFAVGSRIFPLIFVCYSIANMMGTGLFFVVTSPQQMFIAIGVLAVIGLVVCVFFDIDVNWKAKSEPAKKVELGVTL